MLKDLQHTRLLCIGDIMLDSYVEGHVERISPEAPIPVLRPQAEHHNIGGVGNVAANLTSINLKPQIIAAVGDDEAHITLQKLCHDEFDQAQSLIKEPHRPTTHKVRYTAGGHQVLRVDQETTRAISTSSQDAILAQAQTALGETKGLIISDYAKGVCQPALLGKLIALAKDKGLPTYVDPKGIDWQKYRGATYLTPNLKELKAYSGKDLVTHNEIATVAQQIITDLAVTGMLITMGADGMLLVKKNKSVHLPTQARSVFDVSGAGDTVIAIFAAAHCNGLTAAQSAQLANQAAGIVVSKAGTATVTYEELAQTLTQQGATEAIMPSKVLPLAQALKIIHQWRREGKKIGFTNGCFDLLHPGHVELLNRSRQHCDCLIVGLNTDASVARLKGPTRPIQNETARAAVLSHLRSVDLVIHFDEDTPAQLIEVVRPNLLVKGSDYTIDKVIGAAFVQSYGGQVLLVDLVPGHSTTSLVDRSVA